LSYYKKQSAETYAKASSYLSGMFGWKKKQPEAEEPAAEEAKQEDNFDSLAEA
jgi:hypothetical protein